MDILIFFFANIKFYLKKESTKLFTRMYMGHWSLPATLTYGLYKGLKSNSGSGLKFRPFNTLIVAFVEQNRNFTFESWEKFCHSERLIWVSSDDF